MTRDNLFRCPEPAHCPRYQVQARNLRIPSLKAFEELIQVPLTDRKLGPRTVIDEVAHAGYGVSRALRGQGGTREGIGRTVAGLARSRRDCGLLRPPGVRYGTRLTPWLADRAISAVHLSISHDAGLATAFVVAESD